jgi:hypothetical protein
MTLKTLADVRKLLVHIPKERRELSTWQHVQTTLQECAVGEDPVNISVAPRERVPYNSPKGAGRNARWVDRALRCEVEIIRRR